MAVSYGQKLFHWIIDMHIKVAGAFTRVHALLQALPKAAMLQSWDFNGLLVAVYYLLALVLGGNLQLYFLVKIVDFCMKIKKTLN